MDLDVQKVIAHRLEQSRLAGWVSDYLVAWHGMSGRLSPNITVWRSAGCTEAEVRTYLGRLLSGIVPARAIEVETA
jgi:hypothetical protein